MRARLFWLTASVMLGVAAAASAQPVIVGDVVRDVDPPPTPATFALRAQWRQDLATGPPARRLALSSGFAAARARDAAAGWRFGR